ncbi:UNVERIFIED_CONTAM: hypothetical protein K2H54_043897 [Gekko kuhli]
MSRALWKQGGWPGWRFRTLNSEYPPPWPRLPILSLTGEESRQAMRAEQRRHEEVPAGRAEDQEDRAAMRQSMDTSTNAIVDLTRTVTLLVETI